MSVQIGENLKSLRKSMGLTQQQVADKLNISRVNYTRYETNASNPDFQTLVALADFYDVSLDLIFGMKGYYL
jgi:predicted transcriptional regulators